MSATAALPLVARFALIIAGLQGVVAAAFARQPTQAALLVLAHTRLRRMVARFDSFVARAHAGTLRSTDPRHRPFPRTGTSGTLPRGFAWLLRLGSWRAAAYRSQFEHLLADPEMERLLQAAPQAGRILRPLCHALGIRPLPGRLGIRPRPASPTTPFEPPNPNTAGPPRDAAAMTRPSPRQADPGPASAFPRSPVPDPADP